MLDPFRALDLDKINEKKNKQKKINHFIENAGGIIQKSCATQLGMQYGNGIVLSCSSRRRCRSTAVICTNYVGQTVWWLDRMPLVVKPFLFVSLVFAHINTVIAPVPLVSHHPLQSDSSLAPAHVWAISASVGTIYKSANGWVN